MQGHARLRRVGVTHRDQRALGSLRVLTGGVPDAADQPLGALLPGRVGLFVRLVCKPGGRTAALDAMNRYMDALANEPGTEAFIVAVDPNEDDILWLYEWFRDNDALDERAVPPDDGRASDRALGPPGSGPRRPAAHAHAAGRR